MDLYCAVHKENGVQAFTTDLQEARDALGSEGSSANRQAIIPMIFKYKENGMHNEAGDPHDLDGTWNGGSMWWSGWDDINSMRDTCQINATGKDSNKRHRYF